MSTSTLSILNELQPEVMFQGLRILPQIEAIQGLYRGGDSPENGFERRFHEIQQEVGKVPHLSLDQHIVPGQESRYQLDLAISLEQVLDGNQRVLVQALAFLSRCNSLKLRIAQSKEVFTAFWTLGAQDKIQERGIKGVTNPTLKALAGHEFSCLIQDVDAEVDGITEAMELIVTSLKAQAKLAREKYDMGKDQVNSALASEAQGSHALGGTPRLAKVEGTAMTALKGAFGDRVQDGVRSAIRTTEEDDDLPTPAVNLDEEPVAQAGALEPVAPEQLRIAGDPQVNVGGAEEDHGNEQPMKDEAPVEKKVRAPRKKKEVAEGPTPGPGEQPLLPHPEAAVPPAETRVAGDPLLGEATTVHRAATQEQLAAMGTSADLDDDIPEMPSRSAAALDEDDDLPAVKVVAKEPEAKVSEAPAPEPVKPKPAPGGLFRARAAKAEAVAAPAATAVAEPVKVTPAPLTPEQQAIIDELM